MSIQIDGNRLTVTGPVTFANAAEITQAGMNIMARPEPVIDLTGVTQLDSSAVSMLLVWLRMARQHGQYPRLINVPPNLQNLIRLYDLTELIPVECR